MGWGLDLGVVKAADVASAVERVTARLFGRLNAEDEAKRKFLRECVDKGVPLAASAVSDLKLLDSVTGPTLSAEDLATIETAARVAVAAVEAMGGEAHVHIGGGDHIDMQAESPLRGMRHRTISVEATVSSGKPLAASAVPAVPPPKQAAAEALPWAPTGTQVA